MKLRPEPTHAPVEPFVMHDHYRPHKRVQYDGRLFNHRTGEFYTPPARTKQSFIAQCDIHNILKQFKITGQINHIAKNAAAGAYMDLPDEQDFQSALHTLKIGNEAFATLPSQIRTRFDNDPAKFLEFFADPKNQEEAIKLGLAQDTRPPPAQPATGGDGGKPPSEGAKAP